MLADVFAHRAKRRWLQERGMKKNGISLIAARRYTTKSESSANIRSPFLSG